MRRCRWWALSLLASASSAAVSRRGPDALTPTEQHLVAAQHLEDSAALQQQQATTGVVLPAQVAARTVAVQHAYLNASDTPAVPILAIELQDSGFGTSIQYAECHYRMSITPRALPACPDAPTHG